MARILSTALISLAVFTFAAMASPVIVEKRLAPQKGFVCMAETARIEYQFAEHVLLVL